MDIKCRESVLTSLEEAKQNSQVLTGLLYLNTDSKNTHEMINTSERPLNTMTEEDLCPGSGVLEAINAALR